MTRECLVFLKSSLDINENDVIQIRNPDPDDVSAEEVCTHLSCSSLFSNEAFCESDNKVIIVSSQSQLYIITAFKLSPCGMKSFFYKVESNEENVITFDPK